jgi:hypothetical protein
VRSGWEASGAWQIRGGTGGTHARLADLEAYARIVSAAARRVAAAASIATGASRWSIDEFAEPFGAQASGSASVPGRLNAGLRAGPPASAEEVLLQWGRERLREIASGPEGLVGASRQLRALAGHLHRTTRAYEAADVALAATFDALVRSVGSMAGTITARSLFPWAAGALLLRPVTATPHPGAVQGLLALTPGFASGLMFGRCREPPRPPSQAAPAIWRSSRHWSPASVRCRPGCGRPTRSASRLDRFRCAGRRHPGHLEVSVT